MAESNNAGQVFNIRDYLQIIIKRKWYLIMPTIIVPLVAILTTFFMMPTYQSSTKILLNEANVLPSVVEQEIGSRTQYRRQSSAEIQSKYYSQITSTAYLKSLIAKLDIPIPDEVKRTISEQVEGIDNIDIAELAENILISKIRDKIEVRVSGASIIGIAITTNTPMMAKKMTQTLAEIFLEESLAQELAGVQGNITFTEEQLSVYRDKLYRAQNDLKQFRQQIITSTVEEDTTTLSMNLNSIFSAVEALDSEIKSAEERKSELRINLRPHKIDLNAISLSAKTHNLQKSLMGTIPRLAELLGRYSWRDARVVALNQEARIISDSIRTEIENYVQGRYSSIPKYAQTDLIDYLMLDTNMEFIRTKSAEMSKSIGKIKSRLTRDPDIEVTLDRLQSEVDRYRELYDLFVKNSQFAAINQSAKTIEAESKYMIVQPADLPLEPVSPSRVKMLVLGVILGVVLGVGIILLLAILDDSYKKVDEVESELGLQVLATIPRLSTPYQTKNKERGLIYAGTVISVLLIAAIIYMKFRNG